MIEKAVMSGALILSTGADCAAFIPRLTFTIYSPSNNPL